MTRSELLAEALMLDPEERLELIGDIWDSLEDVDVPLSDEQVAELNRRIDDLERDPSVGIPWEEVRARLHAKYRQD